MPLHSHHAAQRAANDIAKNAIKKGDFHTALKALQRVEHEFGQKRGK